MEKWGRWPETRVPTPRPTQLPQTTDPHSARACQPLARPWPRPLASPRRAGPRLCSPTVSDGAFPAVTGLCGPAGSRRPAAAAALQRPCSPHRRRSSAPSTPRTLPCKLLPGRAPGHPGPPPPWMPGPRSWSPTTGFWEAFSSTCPHGDSEVARKVRGTPAPG